MQFNAPITVAMITYQAECTFLPNSTCLGFLLPNWLKPSENFYQGKYSVHSACLKPQSFHFPLNNCTVHSDLLATPAPWCASVLHSLPAFPVPNPFLFPGEFLKQVPSYWCIPSTSSLYHKLPHGEVYLTFFLSKMDRSNLVSLNPLIHKKTLCSYITFFSALFQSLV